MTADEFCLWFIREKRRHLGRAGAAPHMCLILYENFTEDLLDAISEIEAVRVEELRAMSREGYPDDALLWPL